MSNFSIVHSIAHIRQPNQNDCWAAAAAMARGERNGRHLMVWDVKQIAADRGVQLNANGSLRSRDFANMMILATALGMFTTDVQHTPLTLALMRTLLTPGRLAIFGGVNYPAQPVAMDHAFTVYRLWGDGTPTGTRLSLVDPLDGRAHNFTWDEFDNVTMADPHFVMHS
jgi:hypothetical protein